MVETLLALLLASLAFLHPLNCVVLQLLQVLLQPKKIWHQPCALSEQSPSRKPRWVTLRQTLRSHSKQTLHLWFINYMYQFCVAASRLNSTTEIEIKRNTQEKTRSSAHKAFPWFLSSWSLKNVSLSRNRQSLWFILMTIMRTAYTKVQ